MFGHAGCYRAPTRKTIKIQPQYGKYQYQIINYIVHKLQEIQIVMVEGLLSLADTHTFNATLQYIFWGLFIILCTRKGYRICTVPMSPVHILPDEFPAEIYNKEDDAKAR